MRGRSPQEINAMWNAAAQALRSQNSENETLRGELTEMRNRLDELGRAPKEPEKPAYDPEELKESIFDDPEGTIDKVVRNRFGNILDRLEQATGETQVMRVARKVGPDFEEHEENVRAMIANSNGPITDQTVYGAYLMSVGMKAQEEKNERKKKSAEQPAPTKEVEEVDAPSLSTLQKEIAKASGLSEDELIEQLESESFTADELGIG